MIVDVPEGWADQSTLLFVAPPELGPAPSANRTVRATEAVSVRFALGEPDARRPLQQESAALAAADPQVALLSEGEFTCGLGAGWQVVQRVTVGGIALRQLSCAVTVGAVTVVATATAADARFDKQRALLERVLASMRSAHR
ncbi:MAG: hypothetical protein A2138_20930 [Deltaproteobacteria bacterium RBG_16_71_12]|nr:MAG: hypothetical protein A2138_20930 [Deltaproteobacteria bacterium RBG_16_71_12]